MRGQSAFSVYSENKDDTKVVDFTKISHNQKNKKDRIVQISKLAPTTSRNQKLRNDKRMMKKEKAKFSKISTDNIRESIVMFNRKNKDKQNLYKSSEFRVLSSKTPIQQNIKSKPNGHSNLKSETFIVNNFTEKANSKQEKKIKNKQNSEHRENMDTDHLNLESQGLIFDSRKEAAKLFNKMINPIKQKDFFQNYWEKKPLLIKRNDPNYYKSWFSCQEFDSIMKKHNLDFTQNIDITSYVDGVKQKHNPEGRAFAPRVWDFFQQGCSIRLLNPATYSQNIWKYLSLLQEFFGSCVASNVYLTPKGTQGFAPHYDDIEAFVLQLEGRKRWRVYQPLNDESTLPRYSSENFNQDDLPKPIYDCILEQGDMLYFPRGFVHQANAVDDIHSLHITVSCYQLNSWGDFLTKLIPGAIENAIAEDVEFRRGLPVGCLDHNGIVFSDNNQTRERADFCKKAVELFKKLVNHLPIDAAMDQMAKRFIHESLPPCLTKAEKLHSIHGHGETWNSKKNRVENISEIGPETTIKLIRKNCIRLVMENDSILIYHNMENSKIFCEKEPVPLEIEAEAAPAIEKLIVAYPNYLTVDELPMESTEEKITVAQCLYDKGLLVTGEPLECEHEDFSEDDSSDCHDYEKGDSDEQEEAEDDDFDSVDYDKFSGEQEIKSDEDETETLESDDDDEPEDSDEETENEDEED